VAPALAAAGTAAKGSYGAGRGEELVGLLPVVLALKEYAEAMEVGAGWACGAAALARRRKAAAELALGSLRCSCWRRGVAWRGPATRICYRFSCGGGPARCRVHR
jgi:hypothetical protein